ncbi:MAG: IscS subfamily cysteine desulfurase [Leptolyngbya foveolarum]|uniref:cysteine desulfurase n=1 Tax=Leptolyngbya foveolarum TaxID=47253 RepID=A0A2W4U2G0_9CYAN|nr:MAG: IscS subfamily cysteine desulfurase [Leptolyngbya foveolarum]
MREQPLIYLDHNATTPVEPQVVEAMLPFFSQYFGNPSSLNHSLGWQAEAAIEKAREQLAAAINAEPVEIVFTSGATEANNLAIKGVAESYMADGQHIITVETEHSAVLEPCRYLERLGFSVTYLPVQPDGLVRLADLEQAFRPETILVSIMTANNEIGVLQPIDKIGALCRDRNVIFHTDAAQALGKVALDVQAMNIDLLSMTAHKLYGPKGIGALYVRRKNPQVRLAPQMHGGGQERGLRSGTLYTPQIVGLGMAVSLMVAGQPQETSRQAGLRDRLWQSVQALPNIHLNGHPTQRLANNLSVSIEGVNGTDLLSKLRHQVALSSGSACSAQKTSPSHVIKALGRNDSLAKATLRLGLGKGTTAEEIDRASAAVVSAVRSLRAIR